MRDKRVQGLPRALLSSLLFTVLLTVGWDWDTQIKVRRETYSHQRDDSEAFAEQVKEDKQNELMNTTSSFRSSGETLLSSSFIQ